MIQTIYRSDLDLGTWSVRTLR